MVKLTAASMTQAIAKARKTKPFVRVVEFRHYLVTNKLTGATYSVVFTKQGADKFAACSCAAGARGRVCFHSAAAAGIHAQLAAERLSALTF